MKQNSQLFGSLFRRSLEKRRDTSTNRNVYIHSHTDAWNLTQQQHKPFTVVSTAPPTRHSQHHSSVMSETAALHSSSGLFQTLAPGAVGGVCNTLAGHPMDLVKVRWQVVGCATDTASSSSAHNSSLLSTLRSILERNGVRGLYQGVSAPLIAVVPAFAVSFGTYESVKHQMMIQHHQQQQQPTLVQLAAAGGISGLALAMVLGPTERIKCLLQVSSGQNHTQSFWGTVQHCYQTGGVRSLFRGTLLTVARDVPGNAAYFGTYEGIRRGLLSTTTTTTAATSYDESHHHSASSSYTTSITVLAGGLAGVANWIIAIPIDVIKSRWQTTSIPTTTATTYGSTPPEQQHPTGVRRLVVELVQTQGWRALFRGLTPALVRAFPANAACFAGVEATRRLLHGESSNHE